jgi:predicted transcriptional regulator
MSSRVISKEVQNLIAAEMERREYASPNEVLVKAMEALVEQQQAIEGIRRGLADVKAGRVRSHAQADRELRRKYRIPIRSVK